MQAMRGILKGLFLAGAIGIATGAHSEGVTETSSIGAFDITVHLHDFLTEDDLATLRLVAKDKNALALFVPEGGGYAALAASPDDGFTKDGMPATSASAISGLDNAAAAASQAIAACQAASKSKATCVVLLEVAPRS